MSVRWALPALVAACYSPTSVEPCTVSCASDGECPGSLTCIDQRCTDGVAVCGGPGPGVDGAVTVDCLTDKLDTDDAWALQGGAVGTGGVEFGKLAFHFAPNLMGERRYRFIQPGNQKFDMTGKAVMIEAVQAPVNGGAPVRLVFRVFTTSGEEFTIKIENDTITGSTAGAGMATQNYIVDPNKFRHLKIEHFTIPTSRITFEGSPDRIQWNPIGAAFPMQPLDDAYIEVEMGTLAGVGFETAAEVDNFEIAGSSCPRGSFAPLVRDRFIEPTPTPLDAHSPDTGGAWVLELGGAQTNGAIGSVEPTLSGATLYTTGPSGTDYDVEADIVRTGVSGNSLVSMVGRGKTGANYYVALQQENTMGGMLTGTIEANGNASISGSCAQLAGITASIPHRLRLRMRNDLIAGFLDGVQICTLSSTDRTIDTQEGFAGLHFLGTAGVWRADNFIVTAP